MAFSTGSGSGPLSEINVTPLVDVMLVLLIIFMVITPLLQHNVSVDMVKTHNAIAMQDANKTNAAVISITRDGKIYFGSTLIPPDQVTNKVKDRLAHNLNKTVYLKSDARAKYGDVTDVVDDIRAAGVEDLGLLTEQVQRRPGVPNAPGVATP
ncbi:MAG: ExbD/TolR family protein [Terriglobia bacterium]